MWACLAFLLFRNGSSRMVADNEIPEQILGCNTEYSMDFFPGEIFSSSSGVFITDVTLPDYLTASFEFVLTPRGVFDGGHTAIGVFVDGDFAYVCTDTGGLEVVDVSDPSNPTLASRGDTGGKQVFVRNGLAYLASFGSGFRIYNVSDPLLSPVLLGSVEGFTSLGLYVEGNYAYVVAGSAGLKIIDISNPLLPELVGPGVNTQNLAKGVFVSNNMAYIADNNYFYIIDVSNPAVPEIKYEANMPNDPDDFMSYGIYGSGNLIFVAAGYDGLLVLDVSDPTTPVKVGSHYLGDWDESKRVFVSNGFVFYTDNGIGFYILDAAPPFTEITSVETSTSMANGIFVSNWLAYIAEGSAGLVIINLEVTTIHVTGSTCEYGRAEMKVKGCNEETECSEDVFQFVVNCEDGYYLLNDACVPDCPSLGSFFNDDVTLSCLPCVGECISCSSSTLCSECSDEFRIIDDECVAISGVEGGVLSAEVVGGIVGGGVGSLLIVLGIIFFEVGFVICLCVNKFKSKKLKSEKELVARESEEEDPKKLETKATGMNSL